METSATKRCLQRYNYKQHEFIADEKRATIFCFVIMPNHIHLIWQIDDKYEISQVQQSFLKYTAQQIKAHLQKNNLKLLEEFYVNAADRHYQFWERNPLSIDLFTEPVFKQKLNYIHNNLGQEKWKLANLPENYKYSSARFYEIEIDDFAFLTHYAG